MMLGLTFGRRSWECTAHVQVKSSQVKDSKTPGGAGTEKPGDNGYTCQIIALENQRESNRNPLFGVAAAI